MILDFEIAQLMMIMISSQIIKDSQQRRNKTHIFLLTFSQKFYISINDIKTVSVRERKNNKEKITHM